MSRRGVNKSAGKVPISVAFTTSAEGKKKFASQDSVPKKVKKGYVGRPLTSGATEAGRRKMSKEIKKIGSP